MIMKLAVCMVCRNVEKHLKYIFKNIDSLDKYSPILIIEIDNCTDSTENLIREYLSNYKHEKYLISLKNNNSEYRAERIANARNECLKIVNEIENLDYHIMIDSDAINSDPWNVNIIDHYLSDNSWDAISFNGDNSKETYGHYYDKWALLIGDLKWHVWGYGESSQEVILSLEMYMSSLLKQNDEVECHSAFNGFAIYRTEKFRNCEYKGRISQIDSKFFKKEDINKSISFIENLSVFKHLRSIHEKDIVLKVHYPLNSEKNNHSMFKKDNTVKIRPDEICEHIHYNISAKKKNGAVIKISSKNLQKNN